ncbi:MAG: type II toxin-antitoxin system VapC family toxin [Deltaproteobacteria bacterium]|nr:type II toxin-antitoxin system VapC family toxin [Deltaproteobacteria bacterium]
MLYVDTSVIVKLYFREQYSLDASNWLRNNDEAIPLTSFHELEFNNAVYLKRFRAEITEKEVALILSRFDKHQRKGIYYRPQLNWTEIFSYALDLSKQHTRKTGVRSLDILHVASALSMKADRFITFDDRQSNLAFLAELKIDRI